MAASEATLRAIAAACRLPNRVALWAIGLCGLAVSAASVTLAPTNDAIGAEVGEPRHTGGLEAQPAEYERRVVEFFDAALLGSR